MCESKRIFLTHRCFSQSFVMCLQPMHWKETLIWQLWNLSLLCSGAPFSPFVFCGGFFGHNSLFILLPYWYFCLYNIFVVNSVFRVLFDQWLISFPPPTDYTLARALCWSNACLCLTSCSSSSSNTSSQNGNLCWNWCWPGVLRAPGRVHQGSALPFSSSMLVVP